MSPRPIEPAQHVPSMLPTPYSTNYPGLPTVRLSAIQRCTLYLRAWEDVGTRSSIHHFELERPPGHQELASVPRYYVSNGGIFAGEGPLWV